MFSRRALLFGGIALAATGCGSQPGYQHALDRRLRRQRVSYQTNEPAGSIIVDTRERYLYVVEDNGYALRYGVAVGEEGLTLKGRASVGRKAEWPSWTPTASMIDRKPHLIQYAGGVPGGPDNPLGARALYLYRNGQDTKFRIHGTNQPWLIGQAVSNGCVRLTNDDIIDLYNDTPLGTNVLVI
ncbi:MAG TPA: L,D-transpeptidase [Rhizobiaceae bacterium]